MHNCTRYKERPKFNYVIDIPRPQHIKENICNKNRILRVKKRSQKLPRNSLYQSIYFYKINAQRIKGLDTLQYSINLSSYEIWLAIKQTNSFKTLKIGTISTNSQNILIFLKKSLIINIEKRPFLALSFHPHQKFQKYSRITTQQPQQHYNRKSVKLWRSKSGQEKEAYQLF